MNWLDWLFVSLIILLTWRGFRTGFLAGCAGIAGLGLGIWLAARFHHAFAAYMADQWQLDEKIAANLGNIQATSPVPAPFLPLPAAGREAAGTILELLAFVSIFLVLYLLVSLLLRLASTIISGTLLSPFNKLSGAVLGLAKGLLLSALALLVVVKLGPPAEVLFGVEALPLAVEKSKLAPLLARVAHLISTIPGTDFSLPVIQSACQGHHVS